MALWYNVPCCTELSSGKVLEELLLCKISFIVNYEVLFLCKTYIPCMAACDKFLQSETPAQNIFTCLLLVAYL